MPTSKARLRNQQILDGIFAQLTPSQSEVLRRTYLKCQSEAQVCRAMRIAGDRFAAIKCAAESRFEQLAEARPAPQH